MECTATIAEDADGKTSVPQLARYRLSNIRRKSFIRGRQQQKMPQAGLVFRTPKFHTGELPSMIPRFKMKKNRYVWSIVNRGYSTFLDRISKFGLKTKEVLYWDNPQGHTLGEAIFVPNPNGVNEDDGVILSVILDGCKETSYLVSMELGERSVIGLLDSEPMVRLFEEILVVP